jgi:branched-subunit amino acid aminotransferase/4-amino-4-deoxychorismate lyase
VLPGVARARLLGLVEPGRAQERSLSLAELRAADEVFLSNAVFGVMPVCTLDEHRYAPYSPETTALRQRFFQPD